MSRIVVAIVIGFAIAILAGSINRVAVELHKINARFEEPVTLIIP